MVKLLIQQEASRSDANLDLVLVTDDSITKLAVKNNSGSYDYELIQFKFNEGIHLMKGY